MVKSIIDPLNTGNPLNQNWDLTGTATEAHYDLAAKQICDRLISSDVWNYKEVYENLRDTGNGLQQEFADKVIYCMDQLSDFEATAVPIILGIGGIAIGALYANFYKDKIRKYLNLDKSSGEPKV